MRMGTFPFLTKSFCRCQREVRGFLSISALDKPVGELLAQARGSVGLRVQLVSRSDSSRPGPDVNEGKCLS